MKNSENRIADIIGENGEIYNAKLIRLFEQTDDLEQKELVCMESEHFRKIFNDFKSVKKLKQNETTNHDQNNDILEYKKRKEDNPIRKQMASNLDRAIEKKAKQEKRSKTEVLKELADFYGYDDIRSIQHGKAGDISFRAEDIVNLEKQFGIHRDDILGDIGKETMSNVRGFRKLFPLMKTDDHLRKEINKVLSDLSDILQRSDEWEQLRICNEIRIFIKGLDT